MKDSMCLIHIILHAAVGLIGLYMVITYWGPITPPLLSGIAFILVGVAGFLHKKKKE